MKPILQVRGLSKRFGGLSAVSDLSFDVGPDEVVGIIGPNGAGKSTAFNLISGATRPSAGSVVLRDRDITGLPPSEVVRHGLARTFQSTSVYPAATVAENLYRGALSTLPGSIWTHGLVTPGLRRSLAGIARHVEEILELTGLSAYRDTPAGSLAYGYQKKLGVAIGIATRPALLLMDEPAAGLNGEECAEFGRMLKQLQQQRKLPMLLVEHHMALVMGLCHRIVVLVQGRKIAEGTPDEIRANPDVIEAYLGAPDYAHS
ncbi:ABC transporter ATP-binding protein [Bordetella genomosp. 9]|uniref:ABC transporter ATP-binding protein n=1 Tax=Bordetella genomosp. 9 TaxID=1416803 RepID=A0A1W6YZL7_9BORD|nr:ABC transporter ATP-binding protein [Bordetella genomosp. 9]ARP86555.1 ABC transporter ATP-binding protein [Bordetella genomosp. 9]